MGRIGPLSSTHPPGGVGYTWRGLLPHLEIERQEDMPRPLGSALVVLDRVASLRVAVGAAEVEEMVIEERERVLGEAGRVDGDRGKALRLLKALDAPPSVGDPSDPRR